MTVVEKTCSVLLESGVQINDIREILVDFPHRRSFSVGDFMRPDFLPIFENRRVSIVASGWTAEISANGSVELYV